MVLLVRVKRTVSHGKHPAPRNPSSTYLLLVVQWWSLRNQQRRRSSHLARRLCPSRSDTRYQTTSFPSSDRPVVRLRCTVYPSPAHSSLRQVQLVRSRRDYGNLRRNGRRRPRRTFRSCPILWRPRGRRGHLVIPKHICSRARQYHASHLCVWNIRIWQVGSHCLCQFPSVYGC
jgi:hypothetical protein